MKRNNIFTLIFVSLCFLLFATASYSKLASNEDLWEGSTIIDQSGDFNAWPVENIFGPSATLFRDYQDAGFQHYVVWKTLIPVSLDSINLIAWHDWGVDPHGDNRDRNYRGFSEFRLYYANSYEKSYTDWKQIITTTTNNPYGGGTNYSGKNWLEYEATFSPITGQYFKAVFVQAGDGSDHYNDSQGPRVIELDGYYNYPKLAILWNLWHETDSPNHLTEVVDFGYVGWDKSGESKADALVVLGNIGSKDLEIGEIDLSCNEGSSYFETTVDCKNKLISPGKTCFFLATYRPEKGGLHSCILYIESNDPQYPKKQIQFRGRSIPPGQWFLELLLD